MIIPPNNVKSSLTGVKSSLTGPSNYFYTGGSSSMAVSPYHGVLFQLPSGQFLKHSFLADWTSSKQIY